MARGYCNEFADLRKKSHVGNNRGGGRKKNPPSFYEECLRKSDYSKALKDLYFKYHYKWISLPMYRYNSDKFLADLKGKYHVYLDD